VASVGNTGIFCGKMFVTRDGFEKVGMGMGVGVGVGVGMGMGPPRESRTDRLTGPAQVARPWRGRTQWVSLRRGQFLTERYLK